MLGLVGLSGCEQIQGPLSALAPASDVTRSVAALWWSMAIGTGVILLLMVLLAAIALRRNPPHAPGRRGVRIMLIAGGLCLPTAAIVALLTFGLRLDEAQWPPSTRAEAATAFHVDIIAHQWWWEARYPGQSQELSTTNVVHVPAGVPVHLRIMATDVIHGFWVPRIAGKLDAVPGQVNQLRLFIDDPGEYAGVCAEYCGDGHAGMRFTLIAHAQHELPEVLARLAKENP